jgi:ATP-binding cassette subfamily E protein 1
LIEILRLGGLLENNIEKLSGGELQRFAILMASIGKENAYLFDEPSSYLDIKFRLAAAKVIRGLVNDSVYVICVEHDLSLLDYLSDFICCLYGEPTVYGVVTHPMTVREGINIFLSGLMKHRKGWKTKN